MNNTRRGLPLARARIEQIFPKLTPTQIRRITPHGRSRTTKRGEVLFEQGDSAAPFFVVVSGELEVVRPSVAVETIVTVLSIRSVHWRGRHAVRPTDSVPRACH